MNKKLFIAITVLTCLTPSISFAPPKKKVNEVNKKKDLEDFSKLLDSIDKKCKIIDKKNNDDLIHKQLESYKKPESWKLKKYFKETPSNLKDYHTLLLSFKATLQSIDTFANNIHALYKHSQNRIELENKLCEKINNQKSKSHINKIEFEENKTFTLRLIYLPAFSLEEHSLLLLWENFNNSNNYQKLSSASQRLQEAHNLLKQYEKSLNNSSFMNILVDCVNYNYAYDGNSECYNSVENLYQNIGKNIEFIKLLSQKIKDDLFNPINDCMENFYNHKFNYQDNVYPKLVEYIQKIEKLRKQTSSELNQEIPLCNEALKIKDKDNNKKEINLHSKEKEQKIEIIKKVIVSSKNNETTQIEKKLDDVVDKTIIKEEEPPFNDVHPRVSEWFTDSGKRLDEDYSNCGKDIKKLMIKFHAFTKKVDNFIIKTAIKCSWLKNNKNIGSWSYNIPTEIIDLDTNKRYMGTISYGIDKDGTLFHRCFSEKIHDEVKEIVFKNIDNSLFPSIQEVENLKPLKYVGFQSDKSVTVQQNPLIIQITDKPNNMIIKLCKPLIPLN